MNYIHHINGVLEKFSNDDRLRPTHISLYMALFQHWNAARFPKALSINRTELMRISRIGSAKTYTECLKELHAWGYMAYTPSYNPTKGSLVNLYSFDQGSDYGSNTGNEQAAQNHYSFDKGTDYGTDKGSDQGSDTGAVKVLPPYINMLNHVNNQTDQTKETIQTGVDHAVEEEVFPADLGSKVENDFLAEKEKITHRSVDSKTKPEGAPPKEILPNRKEGKGELSFAESDYADLEKFRQAFTGTNFESAHLDFYYEAIGNWRDKKTGEPPRRKDWLATARTFMLNDYKEGKLVIQPTITDAQSHHANGNSTKAPKAGKAHISLDAIFAITALAHSKK